MGEQKALHVRGEDFWLGGMNAATPKDPFFCWVLQLNAWAQ